MKIIYRKKIIFRYSTTFLSLANTRNININNDNDNNNDNIKNKNNNNNK